MPRGRAGLLMIPADEVRVALVRNNHTPWDAARALLVCDRTVRRWLKTGLALYYGARCITREEWNAYAGVDAGSEPVRRRTTVDRESRPPTVKVKPPPAPAGKQRHAGRARPKRKRLRLSRDLLKARGGKRAR